MKKILVRAPNWIGDQILAYPFYYHLRKAYPKARITVVGVEWVRDLMFMDLIDDVHVLPRLFKNTVFEKMSKLEEAGHALKKLGPWDLAISLPNSFSAGWLLFRSGAVRRRGYKVDGRGFLLNDGIDWDGNPERHRAQAYLDLLPVEARPSRPAKEFWGIPPVDDLDPGVPGELSKFDAKLSWPGVETVEPPREKYWVLAPGATAESRRWPVEYFAQLARQVCAQTGNPGVIIGGPKEAPLATELLEMLNESDTKARLIDLTAQGPVSGLWKIFGQAEFTITNESGLAHVASICGSPVQIVCGAADPRRTTPLGPGKVQVAFNPVECWPCERNTCMQPPQKKIQCLRGIQPDTVWEEIKRGLAAKS